MASRQTYSLEQEIAHFFVGSSATRLACDVRAKELVGGTVTPVTIQGGSSYSVYAGPDSKYVVQFRLGSPELKAETLEIAHNVYGNLAPHSSFRGRIGGEGVEGKEPLYVYVMDRVPGMSYLAFILTNTLPRNGPEYKAWRMTLIVDVAKFFALAWKTPQNVDQAYRDALAQRYEKQLRQLLTSLPARFRPVVQRSLDSLPAVLSLPITLLHNDLRITNIMVDTDCHLVAIVDWADSELGHFGLNLNFVQFLMAHFHTENGWTRYDDYTLLEEAFWSTLRREAGGLSDEAVQAIKAARVLGLLLLDGFTPRQPNMAEPTPIQDDASGAYKLRYLGDLLLSPATRYPDLAL